MMIKSKKLVCEITPQLADFLGESDRKKMSRTEVTRKIDAYTTKVPYIFLQLLHIITVT